jgi:putative transposase
MMREKHAPEQIIAIMKHVDSAVAAGGTVADACRTQGVAVRTYYLWRKQYGGMSLAQIRQLRRLQKEKAHLKQQVADLSLDNAILREACRQGKDWTRPAWRQEVVHRIEEKLGVSERRACAVLLQPRATQRYASHQQEKDASLVEAMQRLSRQHPQYGYRRIMALLRAEGWSVNHKRVYRLWHREQMGKTTPCSTAQKELSEQ